MISITVGEVRSLNIILFGQAGAGKSSVINLLAGERVAETSPDAQGCTVESKQYTVQVAKRTFNIWDTIGLGEPVSGATNYLGAIEKTYALIQQIVAQGGLNLLLFCIPGRSSRISSAILCNYRLFFEVLCERRIPIALVVTRLEGEVRMEDWWDRNEYYIRHKCHLNFSGHACVTGLADSDKATEGRAALQHLLLDYDDQGRYTMPPVSDVFLGFLGRLSVVLRRNKVKDKRRELEQVLRDRCMLPAYLARQLAEILSAWHVKYVLSDSVRAGIPSFNIPILSRHNSLPDIHADPGPSSNSSKMCCNILLFGEVGVGKSSVINLFASARTKVAETSPDVWRCTLVSKQHRIQMAGRTFNIWETTGLGELTGMSSVMDYLGAIGRVHTLIQQVVARGGLDLLLFCINGSRITPTMLCSYRLFFEVLCGKRVPITLVATHLEGETRMEEWWDRNEYYIRHQCGLNFSGHACVTGLADNDKAAEGRSALKSLLLRYVDQEGCTMPPTTEWYLGFLELLFDIPHSKGVKDTRRQLARVLHDRCMLPSGLARRLAEDLTRLKDY